MDKLMDHFIKIFIVFVFGRIGWRPSFLFKSKYMFVLLFNSVFIVNCKV